MTRIAFPNPEKAPTGEPLAQGGDLSTSTLLKAYSLGIFQWFDDASPILWWSPDPRAILPLDNFHVSRRLARTIRQGKFQVTLNQAFAEVVTGCAQGREEGTWITKEVQAAYCQLRQQGSAHSVEVWQEGVLAGGLYGVALGGLFAAESMFFRVSNASKVALAWLLEHLKERGFQLLDLQVLNDHTKSLGAVEIPRSQYLQRLKKALRVKARMAPDPAAPSESQG
ncbi:MAG: leucyl/phenylalanyl-tRNA--protein transferase [Gemmataceae bacterium]|nr:leucyl/phenylalanyl-tRNA--protein transferase [Gemmataceae bacterium]